MLYFTIEETNELIRETRSDAFHLEVSDDHSQVADETEPMRRVLAGLPPFDESAYPPTWRAWEELTTEVTGRGVPIRRVRVVSEPLTDYVRFLHALTDRNQRYGEDIRWLPRHLAEPAEYTKDEWWLLDSTVAFTIFTRTGDLAGAAVSTDPALVDRCATVRDTLWSKAIPHKDYMPSGRSG